jgi:serine/threonine-protein kinase
MRMEDQILAQALLDLKLVTPEQLPAGDRPLSEALLEAGLISPEQLRQVRQHLLESDGTPIEVRRAPPDKDIGKFILIQELGHGGTGEVWKAWEKGLNRFVALKLLGRAPEEHRKRLLREAQVAAKLDHPNIVPIIETGESKLGVYVAMKYIEGTTLDRAELSLAQKLTAIRDAALALEYAHRQGVIHRDIKPENILFERTTQRVYITDFGLAKQLEVNTSISESDVVAGTPHYMPPEQAQGKLRQVDARSDVYALGATLYHLMCGEPPFDGTSLVEVLEKVIHADPPPPRQVPRELGIILLKCLEKPPERRYGSAQELADDLDRFMRGESIFARPPSLAYLIQKNFRKNPWIYVMAALVVSVAGAAGVVSYRNHLETERLKEERERERAEALNLMRTTAAASLKAVLDSRRAGQNAAMRMHLEPLKVAYQSVIERAPDRAEPHDLMGRVSRAMMDDDGALEYQQKALDREPDFAPAIYERAILQSQKYGFEIDRASDLKRPPPNMSKLLDAIVGDLRRLEHSSIGEANLLAARGILAFRMANYEQAVGLLKGAVEKDETLEEAWQMLGETVRRQAVSAKTGAEKERLWAEAEEWFTRGHVKDLGYVSHLLGRARVRADRAVYRQRHGQEPWADFDAAEQDTKDALKLDPENWKAYYVLGVVRSNRAIAGMPSRSSVRADFDGAKEALDRSLQFKKDFIYALVARGNVAATRGVYLVQQNQDPLAAYEQAITDYSLALALDPENGEALVQRGTVLSNRGAGFMKEGRDPSADYDAAEKDFAQALKLDPENSEAFRLRGGVRFNRGQRKRQLFQNPLSEFELAEGDYTEALRIRPDFAQGWFERGRLRENRAQVRGRKDPQAAKEDYDGAASDYAKAMEINPSMRANLEERMSRWPR